MIQLLQRMKNKKGFTLIELIVVIAIIAILILIAVPAYQAFVERSQERANYSSAATIYKAAQIHYVDKDGTADGDLGEILDLVDTELVAGEVEIATSLAGNNVVVDSVTVTTTGIDPQTYPEP